MAHVGLGKVLFLEHLLQCRLAFLGVGAELFDLLVNLLGRYFHLEIAEILIDENVFDEIIDRFLAGKLIILGIFLGQRAIHGQLGDVQPVDGGRDGIGGGQRQSPWSVPGRSGNSGVGGGGS